MAVSRGPSSNACVGAQVLRGVAARPPGEARAGAGCGAAPSLAQPLLSSSCMSDTAALEEVRGRVFADHVELRGMLAKLDAASSRLAESARDAPVVDDAATQTLRDAARVFAHRFRKHLTMEEENLVPILRTLDAWGDARVSHMLQEHSEQRDVITAIVEDVYFTKDAHALADEVRWFVAAVLNDMEMEEKGLTPLRDDGFQHALFVG
jgi:hypothetical protein